MSSCLTDEHLILFGALIQWFAQPEVLMQKIMATISGADVTSIKLLTSGLGFTEKRDAVFNLLRHRAVPLDQIDHIQSPLDRDQTRAQYWRRYKDFIEDEEVKVTYTLDNLKEIVGTLERNYVNFQEYATGIGLISSNAV